MKTKMNHKKTVQSNFMLLILTTVLILTSSNHSYSQVKPLKELDPKKGINDTYTRYEGSFNTTIYINSKYNEDAIRKVYPPIGPGSEVEGTFRIRTESNEIIMKTVRSLFSTEKIQLLANREETIKLSVLINQHGEPLLTCFSLVDSSLITVEELEMLDKKLIKNLTFVPFEVEVEGNASTFVDIHFSFQQVLDGTVDMYKPLVKSRFIDEE